MTPTFDTNVTSGPNVPVIAPPKRRTCDASEPQHSAFAHGRNSPTDAGKGCDHETTRPRDTVEIWGIPFDRLTMAQSVDAIDRLIQRRIPSFVVTANLNYCMLHDRDEHVRRISSEADLILADGQPIVWRSRIESTRLPVRVAGSEMIRHLCSRAAEKGHRVFFLGGAQGVAETCAARLKKMYPDLQVAGTLCPPFRPLSELEHTALLQRIGEAEPDLLLVAFGQPKGEKWIHENYRTLGVPVSIQLGASFDFIAGTATRAPEIYQRFGVEWAYRMMSDPKRLVPRYAANAWFLGKALIRDWQRQVARWGMGTNG